MADTEAESAKREAQAKRVCEIGETQFQKLLPSLSHLPQGSYVIIKVETGEFFTGATALEADDEYERRFGDAPGYSRCIGGFVQVGLFEPQMVAQLRRR
jgi:hypothetical protein